MTGDLSRDVLLSPDHPLLSLLGLLHLLVRLRDLLLLLSIHLVTTKIRTNTKIKISEKIKSAQNHYCKSSLCRVFGAFHGFS